MKDHFKSLFNYDRFANGQIADLIIKINNPEKPVKLMAHLLAAQQVWLNRCKRLPVIVGGVWPAWPAETFAGIIAENNTAWLSFLDTLQPQDFDNIISYRNLRGESYQNKLSDILTHVINHGTHHRAQAGQHLIAAGVEQLPPTDYIFFIR
ncbi:MAG TPA: DinB family protein [Mucilaginibacter sp.]|jgi:uncharacterized damage-inducible protein DinB|nr:DinB family protein [Mucilaginibacter sp.]